MRMTIAAAVLAVVACGSSVAGAQSRDPREALNDATQRLGTVATPAQPDAAQRIATLKQDFADFAATYLAPTPASGTVGAVGTSGTVNGEDWRAKYRRVEADLSALIGPPDAAASAVTGSLDAATRTQLGAIRTSLATFYATTLSDPAANPVAHTGERQTPAQTSGGARPPVAPTAEAPQTTATGQAGQPGQAGQVGQTAPTAGTPAPRVETTFGTALALIDRMQRILDDGTKEPGKVKLDRAAVDEIRAELAQIRATLEGMQK
jgi:hypothetical protein